MEGGRWRVAQIANVEINVLKQVVVRAWYGIMWSVTWVPHGRAR